MVKLRRRTKAGIALGLLLSITSAALAARSRPLAAAPAHAVASADLSALPMAGARARVRACWIEYGRNEANGQVATAGLSRTARWSITVAGLLVRHPKGDVVVDVGNSSRFTTEIADYPLASRTWLMLIPGSNETVASAPAALGAAGVDVDRLTVILSHMHVDHAGGLVDLPRARVLLPAEEIAFAARHRDDHSVDVVPAHARALDGRTQPLAFAPRPYETFDESADLYGDGSVVVVKLFGHTPGSVGVFVNLSPTRRFFHVGDAVNVMEAVERRLPKSLVMAPTDDAPEEANRGVAEIARLHEARPDITVLPAHDRAAWAAAFGEPGRCVE
ncbi:MAG: MBL fold metallo-hydrolase [Deltaproteobacteria bacterium]|nr:MBL fold metallo-hydrolase [Deltaproteobacteria bacterium]